MTLPNLWNDLSPIQSTLKQLIKDYETGLTPNLPYFIVGQSNVKEKIGRYLEKLDGDYFNRSLIFSDYGNGKTNLLKYLQLYFKEQNTLGVHYIYQRANVDKPDIFLNLLKLIEDDLTSILINAIENADAKFIATQAKEYRNIAQYINKFSEKDLSCAEKLILMGTGRFYTKNYFNAYQIPPLTDFDRREVFIFFMNLLANNNQYVVFALDELEKIYEKSKVRFRSFLTSYRELIDLSSKINGHYLLTAIVSSAANINDTLLENPAFYSRIKNDMIEVGFLTTLSEKETLINNISTLLNMELSAIKIQEIANTLKRDYSKGSIRSNRLLLADIFNALRIDLLQPSFAQLEDKLEELELDDEFTDMYEGLEEDGTFSKIQNRFFDPLQYYLEYKGYEINTKKENNFFKKTNLFYPYKSNKVYSFILDEQADTEIEINKLVDLLSDEKLVIAFTPESIDITYEDVNNDNITIINYDPKKLFTLLVMFEELDYHEEIEKVIYEYTKGLL
jgi:hypothetical protein